MLNDQDDLSWYARKAGGARSRKESERGETKSSRRIEELLCALKQGGIKGSIDTRTLHTLRLPPGCESCLVGEGTNLYVTGLCTRDCFFCFNEKPRQDEIVVHGIKIREPEEAKDIVARYRLKSVGISGGEPLLFPDRVLRIIHALRTLPERVRIDLYTNGDRATDEILRDMKRAGLDALRFNVVPSNYCLGPVERALGFFEEVAVEIPVIPSDLTVQKSLVLGLDELGVPFLNIHELFSCRENRSRVKEKGFTAQEGQSAHLLWEPVEEGEEAALTLLLFALHHTKRLSTYYCSCRTQEMISAQGLARRRNLHAD